MKFVFVSNFLNPHQYPLACELFRLTGGSYRFVETMRMPDVMHNSGYPDYGELPWLVRAWESPKAMTEAEELMTSADTLMYGAASITSIVKVRANKGLLTFQYAERRLKQGWINAFSPAALRTSLEYWRYCHNKPVYFLAASAFAAGDMHRCGMFRGKCFRWGYFPSVSGAEVEEDNFSCFRDGSIFRVMSVCRMLDWKQPLMYVRAAKALRDAGINFHLDMIGTGSMLDAVRAEVAKLELADCVTVHGSMSNEQVHREMQRHHCLLFTSNKREGWGAVVNEAMGNGCVVIGSSKIGSVPYLIEHGETGLIFEDSNQEDLNAKVLWLARNREQAELMARSARRQMLTTWSPAEAAHRILSLSEALCNNRPTPFSAGPCSAAPVLK